MSDNAAGTDNQQGSLVEPIARFDPSETTRRTPTKQEIKAYFQGAVHDGTYNRYNQRIRIAQKGTAWLEVLQNLLRSIGQSSWIYREGKKRNVYILETKAPFIDFSFNPLCLKSRREKCAYIRGFFDAEGGIPRNNQSRFYIQLVQSDRPKLTKLKRLLGELGIDIGVIHNPSVAVDPKYWRMFVRAHSHRTFIRLIGSWHPRKLIILKQRWMMI